MASPTPSGLGEDEDGDENEVGEGADPASVIHYWSQRENQTRQLKKLMAAARQVVGGGDSFRALEAAVQSEALLAGQYYRRAEDALLWETRVASGAGGGNVPPQYSAVILSLKRLETALHVQERNDLRASTFIPPQMLRLPRQAASPRTRGAHVSRKDLRTVIAHPVAYPPAPAAAAAHRRLRAQLRRRHEYFPSYTPSMHPLLRDDAALSAGAVIRFACAALDAARARSPDSEDTASNPSERA